MSELLALKDTPVPSILVIAGIIFLLLALGGQIINQIQIPSNRQRISAVLGIVLLCAGIGLYILPSRQPGSAEGAPTETPAAPPTSRPAPIQPSIPPVVAAEPTTASAGEPTRPAAATACILTIVNPLVSLKKEPAHFSQELIRVKPGTYPSLDYSTVKFGLQEDGWFEIEVEGRRGWILNDTWGIDTKTSACP